MREKSSVFSCWVKSQRTERQTERRIHSQSDSLAALTGILDPDRAPDRAGGTAGDEAPTGKKPLARDRILVHGIRSPPGRGPCRPHFCLYCACGWAESGKGVLGPLRQTSTDVTSRDSLGRAFLYWPSWRANLCSVFDLSNLICFHPSAFRPLTPA